MDKKKYIEDLAFETYGVTNCAVPFNFLISPSTSLYFGLDLQYLYCVDVNVSYYKDSDAGETVIQWQGTDLNSNPYNIKTVLDSTLGRVYNQFVWNNLVTKYISLTPDGFAEYYIIVTGYKVQIA